jgi:hypothetical protein
MDIKKIKINIKLASFTGIFKKLRKLSRDTYIDWAVITVISTILFFVMCAVGYWTYHGVFARIESAPETEIVPTTKLFDVDKLESVMKEYDKRRAEWNDLRSGNFTFPANPSL